MRYRHYAPRGELTIVTGPEEKVVDYINRAVAMDRANGLKTGVIGTQENLDRYCADVVKCAGSRYDRCIFRVIYR